MTTPPVERTEERHVTLLGYVVAFVALLLLSGLTLWASFFSLGRWGMVIALALASAKALIVAFFFMHLVEQRGTNRFVALVAVLFLSLLVGLMVVDIGTRSGVGEDVEVQHVSGSAR